jgi:CRISPR-associated exonuclease Cas4
MRDCLKLGRIPAIPKGQKCSGCSMKDLCMPSVKQIKSLRSEIEKIERNWDTEDIKT